MSTVNHPLTGKLCRAVVNHYNSGWNLYRDVDCTDLMDSIPSNAIVVVVQVLSEQHETNCTIGARTQVIYGEMIGWIYTNDVLEFLDDEE